jgi:hemoglobin-like flavoprotein
VVQVSGGTLTRTSSVAPFKKSKSNFSGETGSTQFLEQGFGPALFFRDDGIADKPADDAMSAMNPIEQSFELAAERCDDLTPLVYRRLHAERRETRAMFRTEGSELVKGSMLAMTIEAILDLAGERSGKFRMIECEVMSHDAYGTPRELFIAFFGVILRTLQEVLGGEWTAEMDQAWQELLREIETMVTETA